MPTTFTLIEKITVGAAGASSITFTSIPQTYTDLYVLLSLRDDRASTAGDNVKVTFNSDNNAVYSYRLLYASGSSAGSDSGSSEVQTRINYTSADNQTASTFGSLNMYVPNYTSSNAKSISSEGASENNATEAYMGLTAGLWNPSTQAAITSIKFAPYNGTNWKQYSTAYLYGIAKEGVTPAPSSAPYATGGDSIVFDGTYWIHTFTSSGTFTPKKGLTCDYLVVAGGGGSGTGDTANNNSGGGGGGGGLRSTVTATGGGGSLESALSLAANTGYTVTVGAGGAAATGVSAKGSNGSDSVFSSITSTGGGGGGSNTSGVILGANGGSGGGGSAATGGTNAGGTGTTNQGYAGGSGQNNGGGGGGGAGAVGGNGNSGTTTGGAGGAGVATSITGSSVTYAGGGGGNGVTGGAGGSGGGGAGAYNGFGTAGTANTGGGGGSGSRGAAQTGASAGGSGIVIVRYAA